MTKIRPYVVILSSAASGAVGLFLADLAGQGFGIGVVLAACLYVGVMTAFFWWLNSLPD